MEIIVNDSYKLKITEVVILEEVVIKKYYLHYEFLNYFCENEIKNCLKVKIPKILKIERSKEKLNIYFERIEGVDLSVFKVSNLSIIKKLLLCFDIFSKLTYLHLKKISHNDLKLSNILINKKGVVLIDYALSTTLNFYTFKNDIKSLFKIFIYILKGK